MTIALDGLCVARHNATRRHVFCQPRPFYPGYACAIRMRYTHAPNPLWRSACAPAGCADAPLRNGQTIVLSTEMASVASVTSAPLNTRWQKFSVCVKTRRRSTSFVTA